MSPADKKIISIIIATFQRPDLLKDALNSILGCELNDSFDYEVIVADNDSRDHTQQVVENLMPDFQGRLKYVLEAKKGKSFAINTGILESKGSYIAITDDDCLIDKNWISTIHSTFAVCDLDILSGKVIPLFDQEKPDWIDFNVNFFQGPMVYFNMGDSYLDNAKRPMFAAGANLILKRSSIERFGLFQKEARSQDTEICHRWQNQGAKMGYDPNLVVYHKTPLSRLNKNYFRQWQFTLGKNAVEIFFYERYYFQESKRNCFKIPLWLYRRILSSIGRYLKQMFIGKATFADELSVWFHSGELCGLWSQYHAV